MRGGKKKMKGGAGSPPDTFYYIDPQSTIPALAEYINKTIDPIDIARIIQKLEGYQDTGARNDGTQDMFHNYNFYLNQKDETFAFVDDLKKILKEQFDQSMTVINQVRDGNTSGLGRAIEIADDVIGVVSTFKKATNPIGLVQLGIDSLGSLISSFSDPSFFEPIKQTSYSYKKQLQDDLGFFGAVGRTAGTVVGAIGEAFGAKTLAQKNDPAIREVIKRKMTDSIKRIDDFKKGYIKKLSFLKKQAEFRTKQATEDKIKERKDFFLQRQYAKAIYFLHRDPKSPFYVSFEEYKKDPAKAVMKYEKKWREAQKKQYEKEIEEEKRRVAGGGNKSNKKQQTENALLKCMPVKCVSAVMKFYPK